MSVAAATGDDASGRPKGAGRGNEGGRQLERGSKEGARTRSSKRELRQRG